MVTRFYLPTSAANDAAPAYGSQWDTVGGSVVRRRTSTTKANSAAGNETAANFAETTTSVTNVLHRQYISDPLAAQTISGTFSGVIKILESATGADASLQVVLRVVSYDGSTQRGVLYAGHTAANNATVGALGQEAGTTTSTRIIPAGTALSSVTVQDGDRLVIEVGARHANTVATSFNTGLSFGDATATADFALTAGLTTTLNPWIELSGNLTFWAGGGNAVSEPPWTNKTSGIAARNGTTSHTISFGFTGTLGRMLVVLVFGAVTNIGTADWTERLSPVSSGELSVFTKISDGTDTGLTVTHNGTNYPVGWVAYEFPAMTTWTAGVSSAPANDTFSALTGLPGTRQVVIAALGRVNSITSGTSTASWTSPWVEDVEISDFRGGSPATDSVVFTVAHQLNVTSTSITPAVTMTWDPAIATSDRELVAFALGVPAASGGETHTVALTATAIASTSQSVTSTHTAARTAPAIASASRSSTGTHTLTGTATAIASATRSSTGTHTVARTAPAIATASSITLKIRAVTGTATAIASASATQAGTHTAARTAPAIATATRTSVGTHTVARSAPAIASASFTFTATHQTARTATAIASATAVTAKLRQTTGTATAIASATRSTASVRVSARTASAIASASSVSVKVRATTGTATAVASASATQATVRTAARAANAIASATSQTARLVQTSATATATASATRSSSGTHNTTRTASATATASAETIADVVGETTGTAVGHATASAVTSSLRPVARTATAQASASRTTSTVRVATRIAAAVASASSVTGSTSSASTSGTAIARALASFVASSVRNSSGAANAKASATRVNSTLRTKVGTASAVASGSYVYQTYRIKTATALAHAIASSVTVKGLALADVDLSVLAPAGSSIMVVSADGHDFFVSPVITEDDGFNSASGETTTIIGGPAATNPFMPTEAHA